MAGLPLVLLADSQLLFPQTSGGVRLLARLRALLPQDEPRVAYLGAANGDVPEFFELFAAALSDVGLTRCRHVTAEPDADALAFLARAEFVFLAGGDPLLGARAFRRHGLERVIAERRAAGALLVGLSAGAVQLGLGWRDDAGAPEPLLAHVPFAVDAHDEPDWTRLRALVAERAGAWRGLGVPTGGGLLVHADGRLEALRHAAALIEWAGPARLATLSVAPGDGTAEAPPRD